jgi:hypothetical protein
MSSGVEETTLAESVAIDSAGEGTIAIPTVVAVAVGVGAADRATRSGGADDPPTAADGPTVWHAASVTTARNAKPGIGREKPMPSSRADPAVADSPYPASCTSGVAPGTRRLVPTSSSGATFTSTSRLW